MKTRILTILTLGVATLAFSVPAAAGEHGDKHHVKMFEMHDTDGDGVITKAEFVQHAEERFSKMDTDGDGSVTKEEAEAAKAEMRAKWQEMKEKKDATDDGADGDAE